MADLAVSIISDALRVAPGNGVSFVVEVRNLGSVVDRYSCEIVGVDAAWCTVTPAAMELFPERDAAPDGRIRSDAPPTVGKFTVTIRPPRTPEARAGEWAIGAKVQSEHDPAGRAVEETVVTVLPFGQLEADLVPSLFSGRLSAKTAVSIRNAGNRPETFDAVATDKAKLLKYEFTPPSVALGAGEDRPIALTVRPKKAILLGQPETRTFTVDLRGDGPDTPPLTLGGTMSQRSIIPPSTPRVLAALLAFAIAALALWGLFFKPQIDAAIKDAVAPVASDLAAIKSNLPPPSSAASAPPGASPSVSPDVSLPASAPPTIPVVTPAPGISFSPQVFSTSMGSPTANDTRTFNVPAGFTFSLTDIFLNNTGGDGGVVTLMKGNQTLFQWNAADFRTLDDHFVTGIRVVATEDIKVQWQCQPGPLASAGQPTCILSVLLSGTLTKAK
jgi:hypothetical protein